MTMVHYFCCCSGLSVARKVLCHALHNGSEQYKGKEYIDQIVPFPVSSFTIHFKL